MGDAVRRLLDHLLRALAPDGQVVHVHLQAKVAPADPGDDLEG